jgi:AcrR family transcriptional regulator
MIRRRTAQREDIRDLILDGVDLLLTRYGYKKMTMEDLARTVGIGKGTIYLHYSGKEELALAHIDRIVEGVVRRLTEIARGSAGPGTKIKDMLLIRVLYRFDYVRSYSQSLNDLLSSVRAQLLVRRRRHFSLEAGVFAEVLREGEKVRAFELAAPAEEVAQTLIACTNAFLPFSLSPSELGKKGEIARQVSNIADLLILGLCYRSRQRRPRRRGGTA